MINYTDKGLHSKDIRAAIAKRIHDERKHAGLTLDDFAEQIGYSKPTVQKWEKGWETGTGKNTIPSYDQLLDLAATFHCEIGYLLCEYDTKTRVATDITAETGLSEDAINVLRADVANIKSVTEKWGDLLEGRVHMSDIVNQLICNGDFIVEEVGNIKFTNDYMAHLRKDKYYQEIMNLYSDENYHGIMRVEGRGANLIEDFFYNDLVELLAPKLKADYYYYGQLKSDFESGKLNRPLTKEDLNWFVFFDEYQLALSRTDDEDEVFREGVLDRYVHLYDVLSDRERTEKVSYFNISDTFLDIIKSYIESLKRESEDIHLLKYVR